MLTSLIVSDQLHPPNVSLVEIMQMEGWSSAATFAKFYDWEIEQTPSFADNVLSLS